jgi:hypothetical protein
MNVSYDQFCVGLLAGGKLSAATCSCKLSNIVHKHLRVLGEVYITDYYDFVSLDTEVEYLDLYSVFHQLGKPEGRRPFGRPRRGREDNIKMDLREGGGIDLIDLAQDRDRWRALVYTVMNLRVPQNAGNFLSSLGSFSFSGRTLLHGVSKYVSTSEQPNNTQN